MKITQTAQAQEDLIGIWAHVAADSLAAADRLLDEIGAKVKLLAAFPEMGVARDDLRAGMRVLVFNEYVVLYRLVRKSVEIVRVVHGRRDLRGLFTG